MKIFRRRPSQPRVIDMTIKDPARISYGGYLETCPGCGHMFSCGHIANRRRSA